MVIYAIRNNITGKYYIGQTINWKRRKQDHLAALKGNYHYNIYLQRSWNKYGSICFDVFIVEHCHSIEELNKRESHWIKTLNCLAPNGYNSRTGGNNHFASRDLKKRLSNAHKIEVHRYDLDGNYLDSFNSADDARKALNTPGANISRCCRGEIRTSVGFQWSYKKEKNIGKPKPKKIAKIRPWKRRRVIQFDLNNRKLKEFDSVTEAANEVKVNPSAITNCTNGRCNTTAGYKWKYKEV